MLRLDGPYYMDIVHALEFASGKDTPLLMECMDEDDAVRMSSYFRFVGFGHFWDVLQYRLENPVYEVQPNEC